MVKYNFIVDSQFLISGTDASGSFSNQRYPVISGYLGDIFSFTFFQNETYAFSIEDTDFENKYDTSSNLTGTVEDFIPLTTGTFLYSNPVDFEEFGNIIVSSETTTSTTTCPPIPIPICASGSTIVQLTDEFGCISYDCVPETTTTTTTTTIPPIDTCNCGSIHFPASGNLVINETKYSLLHNQMAYIGEEQKFTTVIERISLSGIYPNSITLDFSKYPVYISHSIRLVVRTLEHDIISSVYVGVDNKLLKIEKPIKFNNINAGIDLHNKTILLDVESVCDYEGLTSCCDKMPTFLSIENSITSLEIVTSVAFTTTTTTTPTFEPPLPPYDPTSIVAPYTEWRIEPDAIYKALKHTKSLVNNIELTFDPDDIYSYPSVYNTFFTFPEGVEFWANVGNPLQYIITRPLLSTNSIQSMNTWEIRELDDLSIFEIQFWDSQAGAWSPTERQYVSFKNLSGFAYVTNENYISTCAPEFVPRRFYDPYDNDCEFYLMNQSIGDYPKPINPFYQVTSTFKYYESIDVLNDDTVRFKLINYLGGEFREAGVVRIPARHTILYRSRVIINNIASDWAINRTDVNIARYEILWRT